MTFREMDQWEGSYDDPAESDSTEEAVFIGEQATGTTVVIGREDREEFIATDDMVPLDLEEVA